jgi:hypothetical protein
MYAPAQRGLNEARTISYDEVVTEEYRRRISISSTDDEEAMWETLTKERKVEERLRRKMAQARRFRDWEFLQRSKVRAA